MLILCFTFLRSCKTYQKCKRVSSSLHLHLMSTLFFCHIHYSHSNGCDMMWHVITALICISLTILNAEHSFMCQRHTVFLILEKCLFWSFAYFWNWIFFNCWVEVLFKYSWLKACIRYVICRFFSLSVDYLFTFMIVPFDNWSFKFQESALSVFFPFLWSWHL